MRCTELTLIPAASTMAAAVQRAELWFGPTRPLPFEEPILRVLKFGASCPAAWAERGLRPRAYTAPLQTSSAPLTSNGEMMDC
jgi:hypothetical protein